MTPTLIAHAAFDDVGDTGVRSIITAMSEMIKLNAREELIQRILAMTEEEASTILDYIEQMEDLEDIAVSESRKDEVGIPLDDALKQLGYTREELMEVAKAEGITQ